MRKEKRGNLVSFCIDSHFIDEISEFDYYGNRIGFLVTGKTRMSVARTRTQIRFQG
ncbi:MAG: hypothetical protein JSW20_06655 [Nitrospiraceae bacterium]|nr:MAG: hypothetical protein JSW20_06655 [Nitrospiraceae bacterium]